MVSRRIGSILRRAEVLVALCFGILLCVAAPSPAQACFGSDRPAFLTNPGDHRTWALARDAAAVSANLLTKTDAVWNCSLGDDKLRDVFADLSAIIGRVVPRPECFKDDVGAAGAQRQPHRDWAASRSRQDLLDNLRRKTQAAMACLDRAAQVELFAELSVVLAKAAPDKAPPPAPAGVVWRLANVTFKDTAPSGTKALRIDETHADAKGGFVRITALNDGGCAPQAGMPASGLQQRFLFRWEFDRDVTQLAHPDKISVRLTIEADGNVPCFDLNPIVTIGADERVLSSPLGSRRFYLIPNPSHVPGPRPIEVVTPESGLERSSVAVVPRFQIAIWGFKGNRGMQLEAQYTYALASPPPR